MTFEQATAISRDYQYLMGKELCVSGKGCGIIEDIVVAPCDDINKFIFIRDLTEHGNPVAALSFYTSNAFDVLVVAKDYNGLKTLVTQDISTYLLSLGLSLDMRKYAHSESN